MMYEKAPTPSAEPLLIREPRDCIGSEFRSRGRSIGRRNKSQSDRSLQRVRVGKADVDQKRGPFTKPLRNDLEKL
jgi:hypothetical protein